jgi:release factor glutamine methyltransferase
MIHRLKKLFAPLLAAAYRRYQSHPRNYRYRELQIVVDPGIFHPGWFISTGVLLRYLENMELAAKRVLELGCGSGIISLLVASRGAIATASDINPDAVRNTRENAERNHLEVEAIGSDLFLAIHERSFDLILINPPFYPEDPADLYSAAWFCGKRFEYFTLLFQQLKARSHPAQQILMILSQDCDLDRIREIAGESGMLLNLIHREKRWGEWNYIFSLLPAD